MGLTQGGGPLAPDAPDAVNYRMVGPRHRMMFGVFPRRVRALLGGEAVFDTTDGRLLHETDGLPELYVPKSDVRMEFLEQNGEGSADDFKGRSTRFDVWVGGEVSRQAAHCFGSPPEEASWLRDHLRFDWDAMEAWFDEDEEVRGHLRDPYHRVDVRECGRRVRVTVGGRLVAESYQPALLSETGLPNHYYLRREDVLTPLEHSHTQTVCPYKGQATYWSLTVDGTRLDDAAWSYPEPLEEATRVRDYLCFDHPNLTVDVVADDG